MTKPKKTSKQINQERLQLVLTLIRDTERGKVEWEDAGGSSVRASYKNDLQAPVAENYGNSKTWPTIIKLNS